jgi:hypothetical protein
MFHPIFTKNIKITPFEGDIQEKLAVAWLHKNQRSKSDCLINKTCYKFRKLIEMPIKIKLAD